ncbi:MAG: hypothetical protein KDI63_03395 [Gammaproteobacteria bacterium]|nr:hypothetical protein [Gammaproteobacteria bacterium]
MAAYTQITLTQTHIDAARNSTDDFNPFHDPYKWRQIASNPFDSPIALGFQLVALAAHEIDVRRSRSQENHLVLSHGLHFSNYQFSFVDVCKPGDQIGITIKPTIIRLDSTKQISNRLSVRAGRRLLFMGYQRETEFPMALPTYDFSEMGELHRQTDRSFIDGGRYFLKRKFMNNSNAKNFLVGSLVDQHYYFDELDNRVRYPPIFPVALISCALLEKLQLENYDFFNHPMVYTNHHLSVDRQLVGRLRSNDRLHLLVEGPQSAEVTGEGGLGGTEIPKIAYHCFGLVDGNQVLFRAKVLMALLEHVITALDARSKRREP